MAMNEADPHGAGQSSEGVNQPHPGGDRSEFRARSMDYVSAGQNLMRTLIDKFPNFDPAWPAEVQVKWFEGFDRLTEVMSGRRR